MKMKYCKKCKKETEHTMIGLCKSCKDVKYNRCILILSILIVIGLLFLNCIYHACEDKIYWTKDMVIESAQKSAESAASYHAQKNSETVIRICSEISATAVGNNLEQNQYTFEEIALLKKYKDYFANHVTYSQITNSDDKSWEDFADYVYECEYEELYNKFYETDYSFNKNSFQELWVYFLIIVCSSIFIYLIMYLMFLPIKIARKYHHPHIKLIALINILFGFSIFGYIAALIWATVSKEENRQDSEPIEDKLSELSDLYKNNLISTEEYEKKRFEYISKL